ncbi:MAG: nucleoside hydrolase, partial [Bacillota bacterium]|nr:nucleoside hydrolase [Bacillota bacterium]
MKKIILDVDTGIDDAIAIILALGCNDIDVLGITTVSGNIHVDRATLNTKRLLKFLNREDINVYKGMSKPIQRELVDASHIHGKSGLAGQLEDIEVDEYVDEDALKFIEEQIISNPNEVTIIATGPQTNIAKLLEIKPMLAKLIKSMIVMGGAISVKGNC